MSPEGAFLCWRCGQWFYGRPTMFGVTVTVCQCCRPGFERYYNNLPDDVREAIALTRLQEERRLR